MNWSHVIIEVYCIRTWSPKKSKYLFEVIDLEKEEFKKVKNSSYNPDYKIPKKPLFCPNSPQYICLEKNCPHLAYTNVLKKDYKTLFKKYDKKTLK